MQVCTNWQYPHNTPTIIFTGIIAAFKRKYRKYFTRKLLEELENGNLNYKLNILECIRLVTKSWAEISKETVINCWKHTGLIVTSEPFANLSDEEEDLRELEANIEQLHFSDPISARDYVEFDEEREIECLDTAEIEAEILNDSESEDDMEIFINEEPVHRNEAIKACDTLMRFIEQQSDDYSGFAKNLNDFRSDLHLRQLKSQKQTTILDYFAMN